MFISMMRCNNMVSRAENQAHVSEICMVDNNKLIICKQDFYILFSSDDYPLSIKLKEKKKKNIKRVTWLHNHKYRQQKLISMTNIIKFSLLIGIL